MNRRLFTSLVLMFPFIVLLVYGLWPILILFPIINWLWNTIPDGTFDQEKETAEDIIVAFSAVVLGIFGIVCTVHWLLNHEHITMLMSFAVKRLLVVLEYLFQAGS